jgi:dienelactone hydrolase
LQPLIVISYAATNNERIWEMRLESRSLAMAMLAALPAIALAQPAPSDPEAANAAAEARYHTLPDSPGSGPHPAIKEVDAKFPDHVVYRPRNLRALGKQKLGVVVWGNGGCRSDGARQRLHLLELASHGYLVIAPGRIESGPGTAAQGPAPMDRRVGPPVETIKTTAPQVAAGIDMALAENARAGSPYFGRIDPAQIAVSGTSCGGLQALMVAADPRIKAVVVHNSGVFKDGSNPIKGLTVDKSLLLKLHTPVLYILGGPSDVAFPNGSDDFEKIEHVPIVLASIDVGHGGTFREPDGGAVAPVAVDWLAWQLRGEKTAAKRFTGAPCGLCQEPGWTVRRKKID